MITEALSNIRKSHLHTFTDLNINQSKTICVKAFFGLPKVMGDAGVELVAGLQEVLAASLPL